ncbi:MAG: histidine kinase [Acidobacteriota bacterium]
MDRRLHLLIWLLPALAACTPAVNPMTRVTSWHYTSEEVAGAAADVDLSAWTEAAPWQLPQGEGVLWLRTEIELPRTTTPQAVMVSMLAAHEVYWDGQLLGRSGKVGLQASSEVPGRIRELHPLPAQLAGSGKHQIALRLSTWRAGFLPANRFYGVVVGDQRALAEGPLRAALWPAACSGALVIGGLFFLSLGLADRQRSADRLFGLLCLSAAAQAGAESVRLWLDYPYDWHFARLLAIFAFAWLTGTLLVLFVSRITNTARPGRWVALAAASSLLTALLLAGWDPKTLAVLVIHLVIAFGLALVGIRRRSRGALLIATGIAACLALFLSNPLGFLDLPLFVGEGLLVLALAIAHSLQSRQQRRAHDEAQLTAVRLELELLKRYLNPHSLMNSLNSLAEVFESEPERAGSAIEALAHEVRTLGRMADQRFVTVAEELALCRAHLEVMGLRHDRRFELEAEVEGDRRIPPAIFHTLVENALTHGAAAVARRPLRLSQALQGPDLVYRFEAPTAPPASPTAPPGGGLRYIEARLGESYGERWNLHHGEARPTAEIPTWITTITVPATP